MFIANFQLRGLRNSWPTGGAGPLGGAPKSRGEGAEDFDEFCKNVLEKFSKIE